MVAVVLLALTLPALLRRKKGRSGITSSLVIVTGGAAVTFVAYLAFAIRCTQAGCLVGPEKVSGLYPWWRTETAWQWGAELALASVGLVVATIALALAARERRSAGRAVNVARLIYAFWALAAFVVPAIWEIFLLD